MAEYHSWPQPARDREEMLESGNFLSGCWISASIPDIQMLVTNIGIYFASIYVFRVDELDFVYSFSWAKPTKNPISVNIYFR